MTGSEPPNCDTDAQPSQMPAESLRSTAIRRGETDGLPKSIMTSNEETESDARPRLQAETEAATESAMEKVTEEEIELDDEREEENEGDEKDKDEKEEEEVEEEKTAPAPPVLYKVQYWNAFDDVVFSKESKEPLGIQNTLPALGKSIIEVITRVRILIPDRNPEAGKEPRTLVKILDTKLKINSPAIINAFHSVIDYSAGLNILEDSDTLSEPYRTYFHHDKELKAYRNRFHPDTIDPNVELCERNVNAYEHLGILQDVLFERLGKAVEAERQRHARGVATFDGLWLLFRPGTDVYVDDDEDGEYNAFVVKTVSAEDSGGPPSSLRIEAWNITYDGSQLGRHLKFFSQPAYEGEKEISSLKVFPCEFWKEQSKEGDNTKPLRLRLEERGKMFFKLAQRQCMDYDGASYSWPKKQVKGLTMVDSQVYFAEVNSYDRPSTGELYDTLESEVSECLCHVCLKTKKRGIHPKPSRYSSYDGIDPKTTRSLTDHQYLLCAPAVYAYVFKLRAWQYLNVYHFSDPTFDTRMIDTLVMEDERRRLIKALAKNYQTDSNGQSAHKPWAADFVAGKGEGKIFLLHGKPGVGKTYTAECIAAYTMRPLLSLAISDIGTEPSEAERHLDHYFKRAKEWNAILLIDEADIYMERRETQDLTRNSLVSGFLRAMENCQSILFLTTNRIGSFDDAFVSRIHVSLYYRDFTEEDRRKVWRIFFDKLGKDRKNIINIPAETILYTTEPEVTSLKWNGREIRNAFQTAVALADFDGADPDGKITLRKTHIQQIVRMSQEFKDYLKELHRGDEAKRADRQRIRYDEFGKRD